MSTVFVTRISLQGGGASGEDLNVETESVFRSNYGSILLSFRNMTIGPWHIWPLRIISNERWRELNLVELFEGSSGANLSAITNAELTHQVVEVTDRPTRTTRSSTVGLTLHSSHPRTPTQSRLHVRRPLILAQAYVIHLTRFYLAPQSLIVRVAPVDGHTHTHTVTDGTNKCLLRLCSKTARDLFNVNRVTDRLFQLNIM